MKVEKQQQSTADQLMLSVDRDDVRKQVASVQVKEQ